MILRPYQTEAVNGLREILKRHRAGLLQLPTGGGKTAVFSSITSSAHGLGRRVWIIAPRNELVKQASEHLFKYGTPHGQITAISTESLAFTVHVASRDTLKRRIKDEKIKNWPDLVIIDEAHLGLDAQLSLAEELPKECKIIGVTATPERLDGRGLSELYGDIVLGPSIKDLVEMGFLTNVKYFCPPVEGLDELHRKGTDYDEKELEALLERRKVYGSAIGHYKEYAHNKPAIVFCRSVKAAEETAHRFREAGYKFENIDGKMTYAKRKMLIKALADGKIHGLTSCELITYGLDVPRIECVIMLRPTLSRTLYMQMIGRGLRPFSNPETMYVKTECIVLDHVNNLIEHGHPLEDYEWNFNGQKKRGKKKGVSEASQKLCPDCWMYFTGSSCNNCGSERDIKERKPMMEVDGRLVEMKGPVKLNERPPEQRREYIDKINVNLEEAVNHQTQTGEILPGPIGELLKMAEELKMQPMWVYWRLSEHMKAVNVPLLHEIARQKNYKPGWVRMKIEEIKGRI